MSKIKIDIEAREKILDELDEKHGLFPHRGGKLQENAGRGFWHTRSKLPSRLVSASWSQLRRPGSTLPKLHHGSVYGHLFPKNHPGERFP